MIRLHALAFAILSAAAVFASASAETYSMKPHMPCVPSPLGACWTPVPSPAGWKCHWSMDLEGSVLKKILVNNGGLPLQDATLCDLKTCTAECSKTAGCIAVEVTKSSKIDGEWNNANKCVCTLFGSVTSAKPFEEIRAPVEKMLSGWACMRLPKSPPPPMKEVPNFPGTDRPGFEQDRGRPGPTGTPGRSRP